MMKENYNFGHHEHDISLHTKKNPFLFVCPIVGYEKVENPVRAEDSLKTYTNQEEKQKFEESQLSIKSNDINFLIFLRIEPQANLTAFQ